MRMPKAPKPEREGQGKGKQIPIQGDEANPSVNPTSPSSGVNAEDATAGSSEPAAGADFDNAAAQAAEQTEDDLVAEAEALVEEAEAKVAGEANEGAGANEANEANEAAEADAAQAEAAGVQAASASDEALAKAQAQAKDWQDKFMRLHAEWDTYRRRTGEQREQEKARATEKLVESLIPVLDDFERTVDYAENNGEAGLLDGVKAVHNKLVGVLTNGGVEVLNPQGEAFNALEAQAVATVPDSDAYDETVHEVYQKGYKMGTKVLRPAMVTVTTGGPKRPKDSEEA